MSQQIRQHHDINQPEQLLADSDIHALQMFLCRLESITNQVTLNAVKIEA
jgi:hypothetical protein